MWFDIQYYIYSIYTMRNISRPKFEVWSSILVAGKSVVNLFKIKQTIGSFACCKKNHKIV